MSRVILKSLKIKGFRSFLEEVFIEFNESGLFCIQGKDIRTGGSNGSGKSSLLEAVYWVFGLNSLPNTELKNHLAPSMEGELTFLSNGSIWKIYRTSTKLSLFINGEEIPSNLKAELERKIFEEIGNPSIFESLSYMRQNDQGIFFYKTDSDLKKFFVDCIPEIEKLEQVSSEAQKIANTLKSEADSLKMVIENQKTQISEKPDISTIESSKIELSNLESSPDYQISYFIKNKELSELKEKLQVLTTGISNKIDPPEHLILKLEQAQVKMDQSIADQDSLGDTSVVLKNFETQKASLNQNIISLSSDISNRKNELNSGKKLMAQFENVLEQIKHCEKSKCPTCFKTWDEALQKASELHIEKDQIKSQIKLLDVRIKEIPSLESRLEIFNQQYGSISGEEGLFREKVSTASNAIVNAKNNTNEIQKEINYITSSEQVRVEREIWDIESKIKYLEIEAKGQMQEANFRRHNKISELKQKVELFNKDIKNYEDKVGNLNILNARLEKLESDLEVEAMISQTLGQRGVLGLFFSELLKEIEIDANSNLSEIPNSSDLAVSIQSVSETKTGVIKNKIATTITKSGNTISFKSLSGGQMASVSLATDLALISAIRRRTNINMSWLALDEAMDGMDVTSKVEALNVIKNACPDLCVILIDHATEIKEMFDGIVSIEYDGRTSRIA